VECWFFVARFLLDVFACDEERGGAVAAAGFWGPGAASEKRRSVDRLISFCAGRFTIFPKGMRAPCDDVRQRSNAAQR
jgi:hypothetical protein